MAKSLREFRTLTTGGDQQFNQSNERHLYKLRSTKRNIDSILMDIGENPILDLELAATVKGDLVYHMDIYNQLADAYLTFLHSYRTQRSQSEESLFRVTLSTLKAKVSTELLLLSSILPEERPNNEYSEHNASQSSYVSEGSHTSRTSRSGSSRSRSSRKSTTSVSSELIKQRVKLETAKTRLKYAKEEAELLRKEAVLKAEQNVLSVKREVEEAESSLKAVKKVLDLDFDDLGESYEPPPIDTKPPSSKKLPKSDYDIQETVEQRTEKYVSSLESLSSLSLRSPTEQDCGKDNKITDTNNNKTHNPFSEQDKTDVQNIAKFLVKKDLITSRLIAFDDQPSRYVSWKLSFKHIMLELDASPLEQLDLLI